MGKRYLLNCFVFVFLISFACAVISVENVSLDKVYSSGENVAGEINITITEELLGQNITSNFGHSIPLKLFLDKNKVETGMSYTCSPFDCAGGYSSFGLGETEKMIDITEDESKNFGFVLTGSNINVLNLSFKISSDFGKQEEIPLEMRFFERGLWKFTESSDDYTRSESFGCYNISAYNASAPDSSFYIGTTPYCEKIIIPQAGSLKIGAYILGTDNKQLTMVVYNDILTEIAQCPFFPPPIDDSCIVEGDFEQGTYYICVKADSGTGYKIKAENSGENCGWFGLPSSEDSAADYAIFAKTAKYSEAQNLTIDTDEVTGLVSDANSFIFSKFNRECSGGCVLPVSVSGVSQSLLISDVDLKYSTSSGQLNDDKVYDVNLISDVKFDFLGILKLDLLEFNVSGKGNKSFELFIGDEKIIDERINVLEGPIINMIYPLSLAAGVPTLFTADIESGRNIRSYKWNFGDGKTETTTTNFVTHVYEQIKEYNLTLEVTDVTGASVSKRFMINAGSPKDFVDNALDEKRQSLNNVIREINLFPAWYQNALEELININFYQSELSRLERKRENTASGDEEGFLEIALDLVNLGVPHSVSVTETSSSPLVSDLNEIDPAPIQLISGGSEEDLNVWRNPILQWQNQNIESNVETQKVSVVRDSGVKEDVLRLYKIYLKVTADYESYFIIQKQREDLFFRQEDSSIRREGDSTAIILDSLAEKTFEFYIKEIEEPIFYVSPKFNLLPLPAKVGVCNYNNKCEKELGENYKNCRADCKPWTRTFFYILFILFLGLVLYTALQMWYKTRYETFLFRDRRYLFSLVMFINNANARGVSDATIKKELKKQGWNGEQIDYAIKKSRGQKTGMYEIIPIEKLFAYLRKRKAGKIATGNQGQIRQNINKQKIQEIDKW